MAPTSGSKRQRGHAQTIDSDSSSDSDSTVEAASSKLRHDNRKRVRLSQAGDLSDTPSLASAAHSSDEEDEDDDSVVGNGVDHEPEIYDPDISDDEAVRRVRARRDRRGGKGENFPADNAIIEEITCTNFMCHEHLSISIGPLINFVIGHNGSGKSAVLTALTLCLGGKATATNRGQSLKSFIKEGKDSSTLSVKIKNRGDTAYKPDLYGPSIIVERHFNRNNSSGFKIKNANGKIISTKKADLEDILDVFALQLDNPMNVLTQDMARQFLNSSTPREKYKLFYKGTHLEQLDSDYRILEETLESNELQLNNLDEVAEAAKAAWKAADKKSSLAEKQQNMLDTYGHYSRQMAWAQVEEQEKLLEEIDESIQVANGVTQERTQEAEATASELEDAEEAVEKAQTEVQRLQEKLAPEADEKERVDELFQANKKELLALIAEQRNIGQNLQLSKNAVQRIEENIAAEEEKIRDADNGAHAQALDEIADAKVKLEEVHQQKTEHSAQAAPLDRAVQKTREESDNMQRPVREKEDAIRSCEQMIRDLSGDRGDWMRAYPPGLNSLLKAIQNETRFREKPVGPLGRHVALLKPEWSSVLESTSGSILNAFAVTSKSDETLLSNLMDRAKYTTPGTRVLIGSSAPLNIAGNEPASDLLTWLRVLKIDNDLVRNMLIINQGVEQAVLLPKPRDAVNFMRNGPVPKVRQIFVMNEDGTPGGRRYAFSGSGAEGDGPIRHKNVQPRMQTDAAARLNGEKAHLVTLKRSLDEALADRRATHTKQKEAEQALERHKREAKGLNLKLQRQEHELEKLQDDLTSKTPQTGVVNSYKKQLEEARESAERDENAYSDSVVEKDRLNSVARDLKDQLSARDEAIKEIEAQVRKAEKRAQKTETARQTATFAKNEAYGRISDAQLREQQLQTEREEQHEQVLYFRDQASNVSARVAVDATETVKTLEEKLKGFKKIIDANNAEMGGSKDELMILALEAKVLYDQKHREHKEHELLTETLKMSLVNRKQRWAKFRRYITIHAKGTFTYLLSERQFRGVLSVRHGDKELDISVEPDITRKQDTGRETRTLSGGEKSFSTICLLLSLWDAMGSPIRCLDEFDVFMDSVNRDVSMGMMIKAARNATSRQFILITPQAMGNVTMGDDVKIHKMRDPERGQTTLPFARA